MIIARVHDGNPPLQSWPPSYQKPPNYCNLQITTLQVFSKVPFGMANFFCIIGALVHASLPFSFWRDHENRPYASLRESFGTTAKIEFVSNTPQKNVAALKCRRKVVFRYYRPKRRHRLHGKLSRKKGEYFACDTTNPPERKAISQFLTHFFVDRNPKL